MQIMRNVNDVKEPVIFFKQGWNWTYQWCRAYTSHNRRPAGESECTI